MTIQELLDFGFKEYSRNLVPADRCFQYSYKDKIGTKFYVDIKHHVNFTDLVSFRAECQFDMHGPKTFNVDIDCKDMSPNEVIQWFNNMFDRMFCTYYNKEIQSVRHYSCPECQNFVGIWPASNEEIFCNKCKYERETGFKKPKVK